MLWVYDKSIVSDLSDSFNTDAINPIVKAVDAKSALSIVGQLQNDKIRFPIIAVKRDPEYQIDKELVNFTAMHKGVATVIDPETNNIYYERSLPVNFGYTLDIFATNEVDIDELIKEIVFKYTYMYFLTIRLPYEGNRKLRFGIEIDRDKQIQQTSGYNELLSDGKLYEALVPLTTRGCRLISYVPSHLKRIEYDIESLTDSQFRSLENNLY